MRKSLLGSIKFLVLAVAIASLSTNVQSAPSPPSPLPRPHLLSGFIPNQGQWSGPVRFAARRGSLALMLESHGLRLQRADDSTTTVGFVFEGAGPDVSVIGEDKRPGIYNFVNGNDAAAWQLNVPSYRSVLYRGMYDGVDVRVREAPESFEYDLVLEPHTDLHRVVVRVEGATSLALASDGGLVVNTRAGPMRQTPPVTLETLPDGTLRPLASVFRIIDHNHYGFDVPHRDPALPLLIDPGLIWSTLIGGTSNEGLAGFEAARDGSGDLFISGTSYSADFGSTPSPIQSGRYKGFVARLDTSGAHYDFVTFINGLQNQTYPGGMAADASGGVTLVGTTVDLDFPVTAGAFQTTFGSPINGQSNGDAFVLRLGATGAPVFGTYLGGSGLDGATAIIIAPDGQYIVSGTTRSTNFPTTAGAYDRTYNAPPPSDSTALSQDMFIVRLTADGSQLTYGTFFGGVTYEIPSDMVIDAQGFLTVGGITTSSATGIDMPTTADGFDRTWNGSEDGFIARFKLDGAGTADLKYASFFGGINQDNIEGIALDPTNPEVVVVAGWAWYDNFTGPFLPTTSGVFKPKLTPDPPATQLFPHSKTGFIAKFRFPAGAAGALVWSTFAGGNWEDYLSDVAIDEVGNVVVAGGTRSYDLTTTRGAIDRTQDGAGTGPDDCFVWKLNPTAAQLMYSTYFGGTGSDCSPPVISGGAKLAYLGNNTIALAGIAESTDFPTTLPATDESGPFVAKMTLLEDASGDLTVDTPSLLAPSNNATFSTNGLVRLQWSEVADPSGIEGYQYEVSSKPDFPSGFTSPKGSVNENELIIESMSLNTPFFWRVRAADGAGNLSAWSAPNTFTLGVSGGQSIVNSIQVYPTAVTGGSTVQAVLHLNNPAPAGGLPVTLMTKGPIGIPATVNVAAGALAANFTITTTPVAQPTAVFLYATSNGVGAKGTINLNATLPPQATSLSLDPLAVTGGNPTTGTVTLASAAPAGGTVVPLLSSHPQHASVPSSVTVPAGAKSATFPITTSTVPFAFDVTIEAVSTQNASRRLALKPAGPRLTSFTLSTSSASGGATVTGTVTFNAPIPTSPFPATGDALVVIKSTGTALGLTPLVAVPVGQTSATFNILVQNVATTTTVDVIATYDDVVLSRPLTINGSSATVSSLTLNVNSVSGGQGGVGHVTLAAPAPAGHVVVNLAASSPALNVPPNVTVSSGSTTGLFSWTANAVETLTNATITASFGPSSASANVTVNPTSSTNNHWVTGLVVNPGTVTGGSSTTGTVTLNAAAPSGGATVQLGAWFPATVPPSVVVPAGQTSATFTVSTPSVSSTTQAKVTALLNLSWAAPLTIEPGGSPPPPPGGTPVAPTLLAPANGATVTQPLTLDWNDVTNAASYQIQVDTSSSFGSPFTINTTITPSQLTTSALTNRQYWWRVRGRNSAGTNGAWSSTRSFTVQSSTPPPAPALSALSISPTSVTGGSANATGTATLTAAAPSGGAVVTLSSSNTSAATVPASVTVSAGSTSATFTVTSQAVTTATSVTITGVYGGATRTGTLTVNAPGAPPPPTLSSLSISPTSVTGGSANATGTATLSAAAPSGGAVVTLSSNDTNAATVPASVTVPAGSTNTTFTITSKAVTTSTPVTISGVSGGVTRTGTLTVNPAGGGGTATLTVTATGRSGERVTSSPAGINVSVGSSGSASFNTGTSITLSVTNGRDAIWSGACSSGGNKTRTCTFTLNANASVTANVQ